MSKQSNRLSHVVWIGGAPCAGKSTIAHIIAKRFGMQCYHVDEMLSQHLPHFNGKDQPMMSKWTSTPWNDLWMQPVDVILDEVIQAYREHAAFVFKDIQALPASPTVVEGNVLMPDDIVNLAGTQIKALWMVPTEAFLREHYPKRGQWVKDILATCEDPETALEHWMARDAGFASHILNRARDLGLPTLIVDGSHTIEENAARVISSLGLCEGNTVNEP